METKTSNKPCSPHYFWWVMKKMQANQGFATDKDVNLRIV